ncbi:hypothetical protein G7Y89_g8480 [Cudoniella acicularis]|uniref:Uncharacterized protein n=1 Tax=Cudoniella acicularis TaxID=354080 RepID=A0A8H4RK66_9HELO|nr:hypothetical protein G7Y89_g8480 [Cudoniella acicularis]
MRSSPSSSTPPLSHHANKSSFPQSNLTPVSPPTSINGEDTLPQPGFGWEFEYALEDRIRQKQHEVTARFQRYGRFGMRWEEARLPTPDHFREAYDELVEAIKDDRTPSLSPECAVADTRKLERVNSTQRHLGPKATTKKGQGNVASAPEANGSSIDSWDDNTLESSGFAKDMKATHEIISNFE